MFAESRCESSWSRFLPALPEEAPGHRIFGLSPSNQPEYYPCSVADALQIFAGIWQTLDALCLRLSMVKGVLFKQGLSQG